jgi:hypothetical protein
MWDPAYETKKGYFVRLTAVTVGGELLYGDQSDSSTGSNPNGSFLLGRSLTHLDPLSHNWTMPTKINEQKAYLVRTSLTNRKHTWRVPRRT